ncbi:MAG: hypothetical protein ACT4PJ_12010 [Gemmatimonadaceae bacterium]
MRALRFLVSANPLDDITNSERIQGVAIGGRWFDRTTLDQMIARGARATSGQG